VSLEKKRQNMKTVCSIVLNQPLFKEMKLEHLEILSQGATEVEFGAGQVIFRQGEPANKLYLIESGTVELEATRPNHPPVGIQTLHAGDVLGWSWLFAPFAWNFQARAGAACRLLALEGGHLLAASGEDVDFGYELMKRLSQIAIQRLQAARRKLLELRRAPSVPDEQTHGNSSDWTRAVRDSMEAVSLSHPFFAGLSPEHLKMLAGYGMHVQFKEGETIFQEGDIANRFYLIESGKVVLESHLKDGPSIPIQTIGKGDVLGWSWLYPPYYWNFDARAIEPTSAIFLYGTRLREDCESNPKLGLELLRRMAKVIIHRLQAARRDLLRLSSDSGGVPGKSGSEMLISANK
jgi:CRP/FNR family cyclic AMP-dependent transcriptional regulator